MKIGYIQFRPRFGEKEKNLKRALKFLENSVSQEADLIVLPELFNTGYVFRSKDEVKMLSEQIPEGETTKALVYFAKENFIHIAAGICERNDDKFFNSAVLISPDENVSLYRKAHLFYEEKIWFSPGDIPFSVYNIGKAKVGIMICYDWFFPEVIRVLSLKGAQIVCHPSNLILPYCQKAMLGAAIQNRIFIITSNRVGTERGVRFTGKSQIVAPDMQILASSKRSGEEVKVVDIDPRDADSKRITEYNDLWADRRTELYRFLLN
ncbi:acyltransferase [Candidatus Bathyarchaeota archaeon]|nr:MAG: acyltransferase [Candidatus Bathyarchaeota archaeon]